MIIIADTNLMLLS